MSPVEQSAGHTQAFEAASAAALAVSIIIPARNEEKMIGRCLESLARMDFPRDQFEVILVDNGSTDSTVEAARSFAGRLSLRIFEQPGVRISALRNLGAREARGTVLAFLDADCLAPADWLERIVALTRSAEVGRNTELTRGAEQAGKGSVSAGAGVLGAHYLLPDNSSWVGRTWHRYHEAEKSGEVSHVPAGDLIMRREDFLRLGGFDASIQTNEDYELCERVRAAGMTVQAFPQIGVVHLGTAQSLRVFFRKQAWHGTHVVKVFLRNISGSHNLKAVLFAGWTLLCLLGLAAGAAWAVADGGMWWAPFIAMAGLLLPPMALAGKQVAASRQWADFFPLAALYLTYGVARAKALVSVWNLV